MKLNLIKSFIILSLAGQMAFASDVIMATSEDLKEFDQLISKEPPVQAPNQNLPPGQQQPPKKNKKDQKKGSPRQKFGNQPNPNGQPGAVPPQNPNGLPPRPQGPPNQDHRPPPPPPPQN